MGAVETCSTFYIVQNLALSSSVRHSTWYRSGRCRVLLDILHGTEVVAVEFFSKFFMVEKWALSSSAQHST